MAYLRQDKRTQKWFVCYRWNNAQHNKSCGTTKRSEAEVVCSRVGDTIQLLRTGRIQLPDAIDPADWIYAGGKTIENDSSAGKDSYKASAYRFGQICDDYFEDQARKAESTLTAERVHIKHLKGYFGTVRKITSIHLEHVKEYLTQRLQDKYRGKLVLGATIKKELATFRQIWIWAQRNRKLQITCPLLGPDGRWEVKIPKATERIKFQTWCQIDRRIERGGYSDDEKMELWASLFLDYEQVKSLLSHVRLSEVHAFIYPSLRQHSAFRCGCCYSDQQWQLSLNDQMTDHRLIQIGTVFRHSINHNLQPLGKPTVPRPSRMIGSVPYECGNCQGSMRVNVCGIESLKCKRFQRLIHQPDNFCELFYSFLIGYWGGLSNDRRKFFGRHARPDQYFGLFLDDRRPEQGCLCRAPVWPLELGQGMIEGNAPYIDRLSQGCADLHRQWLSTLCLPTGLSTAAHWCIFCACCITWINPVHSELASIVASGDYGDEIAARICCIV